MSSRAQKQQSPRDLLSSFPPSPYFPLVLQAWRALTMFVLVFVCTWPVHSLILTSWVLSALQLRSLIYIELLFISKTCLHVCLYSILGMECHPIAYLENVYPSFMTQLKPHLCCEVFLNLCKQSWGFPPLNSCIEANATPLSFTCWMIIVHLYVWFCY